jgi:hypothetical protein
MNTCEGKSLARVTTILDRTRGTCESDDGSRSKVRSFLNFELHLAPLSLECGVSYRALPF